MKTTGLHGELASPYFLESAPIGFRCWSRDDLPLALALWADIDATRFIGGPFSGEQISARLDREIANMRDHQNFSIGQYTYAPPENISAATVCAHIVLPIKSTK
jgi:hypothetical protein